MSIAQAQQSTTEQPDRRTYFVWCTHCGFYPGDVDDVAAGVSAEQKAVNLAQMHRDELHQTFVIDSSVLDKDPSDLKRKVVA